MPATQACALGHSPSRRAPAQAGLDQVNLLGGATLLTRPLTALYVRCQAHLVVEVDANFVQHLAHELVRLILLALTLGVKRKGQGIVNNGTRLETSSLL